MKVYGSIWNHIKGAYEVYFLLLVNIGSAMWLSLRASPSSYGGKAEAGEEKQRSRSRSCCLITMNHEL